jgi:hypothetical protein
MERMSSQESPEKERRSPPRKEPDIWDREAKEVIKLEMQRKRVDVDGLIKLLKEMKSPPPSRKSLVLRLSRGTFSFGFALKILKALDVDTLDISDVNKHIRS